MGSPKTIAVLAGALVVAVVLFIVLSGGDDEQTSATTTAATTSSPASTTTAPATTPSDAGGGGDQPQGDEIVLIKVRDGQPVGGVQELEFPSGGTIRFVVRSDVDEEVHLHGYDIAQDISAGGEIEFQVPADIEGIFEVELEDSAVPIAEISVVPQ